MMAARPRCEWCHDPLVRRSNMGPPPRYCSAAHRQRAYEHRRRADVRYVLHELTDAVEALLPGLTTTRRAGKSRLAAALTEAHRVLGP